MNKLFAFIIIIGGILAAIYGCASIFVATIHVTGNKWQAFPWAALNLYFCCLGFQTLAREVLETPTLSKTPAKKAPDDE